MWNWNFEKLQSLVIILIVLIFLGQALCNSNREIFQPVNNLYFDQSFFMWMDDKKKVQKKRDLKKKLNLIYIYCLVRKELPYVRLVKMSSKHRSRLCKVGKVTPVIYNWPIYNWPVIYNWPMLENDFIRKHFTFYNFWFLFLNVLLKDRGTITAK